MKFEAVTDTEWSRKFKRYSPMWAEFEAPFKMLESGGRVKIEGGKWPEKRRKCFMEYAKRYGMRLASAMAEEGKWIYFCRRDDGWKDFAQERKKIHGFAVKSKERGNLAIEEQSAGGVQPTKPAQALSRRAL